MDTYKEFASLYDELMNDFDYEMWFNYIESIFIKYEKTPKTILEMACGTGNLSVYMAAKGYKLTCFDLSEEMLSQAYKKLNRYKNVKLLNQNMVDFNLKQKYQSVISICDSINYIIDIQDLEQSFNNVYNHLEDGGIFIFDINSFYKLSQVVGNNTFVEDREDVFYTWENYYDDESNICEFYLSFFVNENENHYIRFDEEHRERAYTTDEIVKLLKSSGFNTIDYYDAFTFDQPNKTTERINFVAIK